MKKYLTLAAVLGTVAFVSVSYLAQATEHVATTTTEIEATTTTTVTADTTAECEATVAASFEGQTPSQDEREAALKACVDAHAAGDHHHGAHE